MTFHLGVPYALLMTFVAVFAGAPGVLPAAFMWMIILVGEENERKRKRSF